MHDRSSMGGAFNPTPCPLPSNNSTKSFWHTVPVLQGHRTTPDLPSHVEHVIIGSGITGASALRYLVDAGIPGPVLVLEAREACWGATGRNGGHLQPLLIERTADIVAFEVKNCEEVADYVDSNKIDCDFRQAPACRMFWKDHLVTEAKKSVEALQSDAPELGKRIQFIPDPDGMERAGVLAACKGATLTKGAGSLWPYKYVTWILSSMLEQGHLNLQTNTPVTSISAIPSVTPAASPKERYKVTTPRGTLTCTTLLLATNAYTSHLLPSFADLIVPVRETMTALLPPPSLTSRLPHSYGIEGLSTAGNDGSGEYLIQRPDSESGSPGELMLGGGRTFGGETLPSVGASDDGVVDGAVVAYLRQALPRSLTLKPYAPSPSPVSARPAADKSLELKAAWTGIWAASRDGNPWVGPVPSCPPGLFLCAAYTGHGMPNATLCARAVVQMMLEEKSASAGPSPETLDGKLAALRAQLVEAGDLPKSYFISTARMERARKLPDVLTQDRMGILGNGLPEGL